MGKQRTRKSAAKRFKISSKGKLLHRSHYLRHLRSKKSSRQIRSLKLIKVVTGKYEKKIKKMLGVR
ncbi:50S ribosomal protein L35 [Candidatus Roizmanbacteria bacterium RIFCSPHIGHO2_01_FULL_35_10]|uniref:Large ribosomal subunit protein bL35 n=1 Tax=Candidatus Roizmanbacteria bacterium RIFCSPLOWO2_01_FULL_35_13 TaxID=1802055 RepID=A0A1F7I744_9BACT|nr:MAG: 50S ribosomal protein L35 [Candidatus Roizmanbacteria bacterium RIFCSPHIGHO2_01_FULL_35_10]OGK39198.1 MAG: 50S ribosomal protein L35 [Candidatus Roizmanbacteria bacterium RIFCSPLOWO2_01_FULL_35_13]